MSAQGNAAYVVPAVGAAWRNRHTGEETMITRLDTRVERVPGDNGFRDEYEFVVHHTVNAPPGFSEGYGDDLSSFLSHWRPVDQSNNRLAEREVEAGTSMGGDARLRTKLQETGSIPTGVGFDLPWLLRFLSDLGIDENAVHIDVANGRIEVGK